jgi:hypothetical protein
MNEQKAKELLKDHITPNGGLRRNDERYISWQPKESAVTVDGEFTTDELEAIIWWMQNH